MEKRITKKILAILMLITILSTDFFVLGTSLITYATELTNIQFSVYFKESTTRTTSTEQSIKNKNLKLYAEIKVNTEDGYIAPGAQIVVADSNFNIVSTDKGRIEGNKIILENISIDRANPVEVEIGIEPKVADEIAIDMLTKQSTIKLSSTYIYSENRDGETFEDEKQVRVNYKPDQSAEAELTTEIITNQLFEITNNDGQKENKRMIQLLVKSRLTENQYPVKQTKLTINHPEINGATVATDEVTVLALGKLATNGKTDISNITNQNGVVEITINNNTEENKPISWNKNLYDELVVTFLYEDGVDATDIKITTNSNLQLYDDQNKTPDASIATSNDNYPNQVLIGRTEVTTPEIFKGQLYANATGANHTDVQYNTKSELIITNADVVEEIVMKEERDVYAKEDETKIAVNTKYISTEVNVNQVLNLFGTNGNIEIMNGNQSILINSEDLADADENGNLTITYEYPNQELEITTSNPVNVGILELKHTKAIVETDIIRAELQRVKTLNTKNSVVGTVTVEKQKQNIVQNATEASFNLTETVSKATLTVNKQSLSTTNANDVTLGITLVTDGVQYDLYKNPVIRLEMPEAVTNIAVNNIQKAYDDVAEFGVPSTRIIEENGIKILEITLEGEQKSYPTEQLYIQADLSLTLSQWAATQEDVITMKYTNANATQYVDGGVNFGKVERKIGISGVGELLTMFNLSSNENTSLTETIMQQVSRENAGANLGFGITVFNDTEADMTNAKILGKLPTTGNIITGENVANTLETTLTSINASNATIYYTENVDATTDINDSTNGWTTDLTTLTNAKLYLIDLGTLSKGSVYTSTVNVKLPNTIPANAVSYTEYEFIYDTGSKSSRKIGLITSLVAMLETTLTAQVGQDILENNAPVKEGEVIKYTATVKNNGTETFEGIQLKAGVPEGTVYVQPVEDYVNVAYTYYEEIADKQEIFIGGINLAPGQSYTTEYEVRVNKGELAAGSVISNKSTVIYDNESNESSEVTNILQESNIRVTIKDLTPADTQIYAGTAISYMVYVENLSDDKITDLKMQIISDVLTVTSVTNGDTYLFDDLIPEKISIEELPKKGIINFLITAIVNEDATKINTSVIVEDTSTSYKSNMLAKVIPYTDASITITATPEEGEIIKYNEQVKYSIIAKNTGTVEGIIKIEDIVSDYLKVEEIWLNGELKSQRTDEASEKYVEYISNTVSQSINLVPGEELRLEIVARVIYNPSEIQGAKSVTNYTEVSFASVKKNTAEITHILQPTAIPEENLGNIISGSIWLDNNEDQQKDVDDNALSGVNVKLYDESTNTYLLDENSQIIQNLTDSDGAYIFTNIPDGAYKIVIDYDMDKYEPTTNSIVKLQNITVNEEIITVTATEIIEVENDINGINIALKEIETTPESSKKHISGLAWLDANKNGQYDDEESLLQGITVKLYNNGNIIEETLTNKNGQYYFRNVEKGAYIVIFEYDTEKYEPTTFLAQGVDTTRNSKADINKLTINGKEITVTSTEIIDLQENVTDINIGLKEKKIGGTENPPIEQEDEKVISGLAWLDTNRNGQKDADETILSGIKVRLYDSSNKSYVKDSDGNIIETTTDNKGKYALNVEKGSYIVVFEFDTNEYEVTTYLADGVDTSRNSKALLRKVEVDGKEVELGVTDVINVQDNVFNINLGLKEILIFDLELDKYISRIVVQNGKGTKAYEYENETFAKAEIHRKQIQGSLVVLEYTIKVKNNGEIAGNARNIVDYLPSGLTFSSELNKDWYLSGNYLYTKSLENVEINPGEEKELKLILTKTMTNENTGLINNRAEIYQDYNKYGENDIDSTPNNQVQNEDDYGSVDVIIGISTGGSTFIYTILLIVNMILIGIAIKLMMKNNIIKISTKKGGRG